MLKEVELLYCIVISKFNRLRMCRKYNLRESFQDDLTDRRIEEGGCGCRKKILIEDLVRKAKGVNFDNTWDLNLYR